MTVINILSTVFGVLCLYQAPMAMVLVSYKVVDKGTVSWQGSKGAERSLAELKDFAAQLKSLPNITRHIHLAEAVNKVIAGQSFRDRVSVEQSLLDGRDIDKCCETIEVGMLAVLCRMLLNDKNETALLAKYIETLCHHCVLTWQV